MSQQTRQFRLFRLGTNSNNQYSGRSLMTRFCSLLVGLWASNALLDNVQIEGIGSLVAGSAILALAYLVVRPIFITFSFCLILLTFGLTIIIIDAVMLLITSTLATTIGLNFQVHGFWTAICAAFVIGLIYLIISNECLIFSLSRYIKSYSKITITKRNC